MVSLGKKLKFYRKANNLTLDQLSKDLNRMDSNSKISKGRLSRWENDKDQPQLTSIKLLATYYNISSDYLMGISDYPQNKDMIDLKNIFSTNLYNLMSQRNETVSDLAFQIDTAYSTVSDWYHGRKMPRYVTLQKIADHFNVKVTDMLETQKTDETNKNCFINNKVNLSKFIGNKIKTLRKSRGMDQQTLADRMNTSRVTISRYESGNRTASQDFLFKLTNVFNVNVDYFFPKVKNVKEVNTDDMRQVPLIGTVACDLPLLAEKSIDGYVPTFLGDKYKNDIVFGLKCKDNSMWPTLNNGDIVFAKQQSTVEDGKIAAVLLNDSEEVTLRRIKHIKNEMLLMPDNINKFSSIVISKNNHKVILGRVIKSTRNF